MMLEILSRERIRRKEARERWNGNLLFPQLLFRGIKEEVSEEFVGVNQFHSNIPSGAFKQEVDEGFMNIHNCTATLNIKKEPFDSNEATSVENHLFSFPTPGRTDDEDTEDERVVMDDDNSVKPTDNLVAENNDINGLEEVYSETPMISEIEESITEIHSQDTCDLSKLEVKINNNAEGSSGTCNKIGKDVKYPTSENIGGNYDEKSAEESRSEIVVDTASETLKHFVTTPRTPLKEDEILVDFSVEPMKKVEVEEVGINLLKESSSYTPMIREIEEISPEQHSQNTVDSSKCDIEFYNKIVGTFGKSFVKEVEHSTRENLISCDYKGISKEESKSEIVVCKVNEPLRNFVTPSITSAHDKEGKVEWNLPPPVPASKRYYDGTEKREEALRPPCLGPPVRWMIPVPMHLRGHVTGSGGFHTNKIQRLTGTWITWDSQHCIVEGSRAGVARASSMIQGRICRIN